jgi:hypothetical protein
MQYFLGLAGFKLEAPFHHSMMTHFRKRLTDVLAELNEIVATEGAKETKDDDDNNDRSGGVKGKAKRASKKSTPSANDVRPYANRIDRIDAPRGAGGCRAGVC